MKLLLLTSSVSLDCKQSFFFSFLWKRKTSAGAWLRPWWRCREPLVACSSSDAHADNGSRHYPSQVTLTVTLPCAYLFCVHPLLAVYGIGCKSSLGELQLCWIYFSEYTICENCFPRQTDQTIDYAVCQTTCVNVTVSFGRLSARSYKDQYHYSRWNFADLTLIYILKFRIYPSFINLVMCAMFIWSTRILDYYSCNSICVSSTLRSTNI